MDLKWLRRITVRYRDFDYICRTVPDLLTNDFLFVNRKKIGGQFTPITWLAEQNKIEAVEYLLKHGCSTS